MCLLGAPWSILFNLLCNMTMFWKSWIPIPLGSCGEGRWCGQNICYHVAAFHDSIEFDMEHDHVLKKLNYDYLTPTPGSVVGGGGSADKIFANMFLHSRFPLIWYATWQCSVLIPRFQGGGRSWGGGIFATMLLNYVIPFNLIWNMTMIWKSWISTYWPHP